MHNKMLNFALGLIAVVIAFSVLLSFLQQYIIFVALGVLVLGSVWAVKRVRSHGRGRSDLYWR